MLSASHSFRLSAIVYPIAMPTFSSAWMALQHVTLRLASHDDTLRLASHYGDTPKARHARQQAHAEKQTREGFRREWKKTKDDKRNPQQERRQQKQDELHKQQ